MRRGTTKERAMIFPTSTVGKKILMTGTGQMMVLFVIIHLLGNTTIFFNNLNTYAAALHAMPVLVWMFRLFMALMLILHVYLGIVLTLENKKAKPVAYAVNTRLSATFAGKNMIWTGAIIGAFLIYHLLHFTVQIISPDLAAITHPDMLGRPDVFRMVVSGFQQSGTAWLYVFFMATLLLHLTHGIQSSFQTWGLNNEKSLPIITRGGQIAATILFLGYAAIPVVILMGIVK
jgi:succinate dehydrogenase / fumarate reductase, cytochrome b subunit